MSEPLGQHRRFPIGLTIATAIALAILVGLGVWQLERLKWKEALLAHVAELQGAKPQSLEWTLQNWVARGRDADLVRVSVVCPGLASAPFVEVYDLRDGRTGARIVSACPVDAAPYGSVLVDRGFMPDADGGRPQIDPADRAPIEIVGVLRRPEHGNFTTPKHTAKRWYTHDVPSMAAALNAQSPAPLVLYAETSTNPQMKALTPAPLPVEIPNRHFEYALTWFSLAAALAFVYLATLFKRLRG